MFAVNAFAAGFLLVVLYLSAIVLSGYVVVMLAHLFSPHPGVRVAAVIIFGTAQLRFVIDAPASAVIESMNITHVLVSQTHEDVPIVALGQMLMFRSLDGMITKTNVGPLASAMVSTASSVGLMLRLEQTYDEISRVGALQPVVHSAWRSAFVFPPAYDGARPEQAARNTFFQTGWSPLLTYTVLMSPLPTLTMPVDGRWLARAFITTPTMLVAGRR